MGKKKRDIIAYVMHLPKEARESIRALSKRHKRSYRAMLITDLSKEEISTKKKYKGIDIILTVDFGDPRSIAEALNPYQNELAAITCRGEAHIMKFVSVVPHVPYLRTPTTESLKWSTDKLEMRRRFSLLAKQYSPKYAVVKENTQKERKRIIEKIGFPMMVKPASLAQSMLVSICYHEEELERSLRNAFRKINKVYDENRRLEIPKLLVEEFMDGDMYSVDAYVNARGTVYFCPLTRVFTGRNIGQQDFYNYLCITPTTLKEKSIKKAHDAVRAGIHALGLRNTSAHVELMKMDDEWKIIEIGPRVGGFRHKLHELSCGMDHSQNDVLIRLPEKPILPSKCIGYAANLKWYPTREGEIIGLKGIKKIQELASFVEISIAKKIGERSYFAQNGGKAVFTLILFNKDRSKLLADIRRIEQNVEVQIA